MQWNQMMIQYSNNNVQVRKPVHLATNSGQFSLGLSSLMRSLYMNIKHMAFHITVTEELKTDSLSWYYAIPIPESREQNCSIEVGDGEVSILHSNSKSVLYVCGASAK